MTVAALVALALALLFATMVAVNLRLYRPPPPAPQAAGAGRGPRVAVLIPARDEAANIGPALDAALASRGVEAEAVVLDDGSTDGTAALAAAHGARVVAGAPLPPGTIGKPHACAQLGEATDAPLLLFLDADVRVAPDMAARMAAQMEREGLDLLSGFPRLVTRGLMEQLVIPQILTVLLGYLPLPLSRARPGDPSLAAACGQIILVRRAAYERAGGHQALLRTIHDGIGLARNVRAAGGRTGLCDLSRLATCRMYGTAGEVWRGFLKNARGGMATPRGLPVWTLLLGGGHVLPLLLLPFARGGAPWLLLLALLLAWGGRAAIAARTGQTALSVALHPLGVVVSLAIQWTALLGGPGRAPAVWRGRRYDV